MVQAGSAVSRRHRPCLVVRLAAPVVHVHASGLPTRVARCTKGCNALDAPPRRSRQRARSSGKPRATMAFCPPAVHPAGHRRQALRCRRRVACRRREPTGARGADRREIPSRRRPRPAASRFPSHRRHSAGRTESPEGSMGAVRNLRRRVPVTTAAPGGPAIRQASPRASAYQLLAGRCRFVCSNGLVVGDASHGIRIPHKGNIQHEVIDGAFRVLDDFGVIDQAAERMKALDLKPEEGAGIRDRRAGTAQRRTRRGPAAGADHRRTTRRSPPARRCRPQPVAVAAARAGERHERWPTRPHAAGPPLAQPARHRHRPQRQPEPRAVAAGRGDAQAEGLSRQAPATAANGRGQSGRCRACRTPRRKAPQIQRPTSRPARPSSAWRARRQPPPTARLRSRIRAYNASQLQRKPCPP